MLLLLTLILLTLVILVAWLVRYRWRLGRIYGRLKKIEQRELRHLQSDLGDLEKLISRHLQFQESTTRKLEQLSGNVDLLQTNLDLVRSSIGMEFHSIHVESSVKPLLSIAIPSYNRPKKLEYCLSSIISELPEDGSVEVLITDDASPNWLAAAIGQKHATCTPQVGFRRLPANIGLERNLIECARECRGEYLLILGNDDALTPGALSELLTDLSGKEFDIFLYEKSRRNDDLSEAVPPVPGSTPVKLSVGDSQVFSSPLQVAASTGLLSAFGFISTVVLRRQPFLDIDPSPYFGLTLYPQVAMMFEAFSRSQVKYRNYPIVIHRTPTQLQKRSEATGRPEETFMSGGDSKLGGWFGPTYAAMLFRLTERSDVSVSELLDLPEALFTNQRLIDWIQQNTLLSQQQGMSFCDSVLADAEEFLRLVEHERTHKRR